MSIHDPLQLYDFVREVPDFPKPGILYRDITPLLADAQAFQAAIQFLAKRLERHRVDEILAIESRGFIFGAALALHLKRPLHLVRKAGKLPRTTFAEQYSLEYGTDSLELHTDAIKPGTRYAIIDDVIATGGTAAAVCRLTAKCGGIVACCAFLLELRGLDGRLKLNACPVESLLSCD
ncbi:MAG: adenine phosphoribosyltransferase [Pseudomonadales bacterium]|nr:adenine phosphoribosyltransferase [Pseudomonadales bacterium]